MAPASIASRTSAVMAANPKVIIGGQFTSAGGAVRNNIAAIDGVTGLALTWNPNASAAVMSLVALGTAQGNISRVYAGGSFSTIGGQSRSCIAARDATGAATAWNPGANNTVYSLASLSNNIYIGGAFTTAGGQSRSHIAEIDATTVSRAVRSRPHSVPPYEAWRSERRTAI